MSEKFPSRAAWRGLLVGGIVIFGLAAILWLAPAPQRPSLSQDRLYLLTSFAPIYSWVVNVAGERAVVENLLPPGVGPHGYAFKPDDVGKVSRAQAIFINGLGLEEWLAGLLANAGAAGIRTVALGDGLAAPDGNPHVWLDPLLAAAMTEKIGAALSDLDPAGAPGYTARAQIYKERLKALGQNAATQLGPVRGAPFVAFHDALPYFNARFGLNQVAVFEEFPGQEPSPRDLEDITVVITKTKARAILVEPQFSPKLAESFAADLKIPVAVFDTMETGELSAEFYERVMMQNMATLIRILQ